MSNTVKHIARLSSAKAITLQIGRLAAELEAINAGFSDEYEYLRNPERMSAVRNAAKELSREYGTAFSTEMTRLQNRLDNN